jgi:CMP-N-acetylneuraminic acid synthetase
MNKIQVLLPDGVGLRNFVFTDFIKIAQSNNLSLSYWNATPFDFLNSGADALVSVLPVPHQYNPHWIFEAAENDYLKIATGDVEIIKHRQDLPKAFYRDRSIYITKTEVIKEGRFFENKLTYIESNPTQYVNIDTIKDWEKSKDVLKIISFNLN